MKIYFVANARMPTEKAHGIQIAKMCEAFIEAGHTVTLLVPRRTRPQDVQPFYGLRVPLPVTYIAVPDWYLLGPIGFWASSLFFMLRTQRYLRMRRRAGEAFVIYTVDIDSFSYAFLPRAGTTIAEMHSPKRASLFNRIFFARASLIVATNNPIAEALTKTFNVKPEQLVVEPNGVDLKQFGEVESKSDARAALNLPQDKKIALYVGRPYGWKGLQILADAAALVPEVSVYFLGATAKELEREGMRSFGALHAAGGATSQQVPQWLAAADALVVLGTKENDSSYRYTSPMKVYEYAAAGRPIVASNTPALRDMLSEGEAVWYTPDDSHSLADAMRRAAASTDTVAPAFIRAQTHTWAARAQRILSVFAAVK